MGDKIIMSLGAELSGAYDSHFLHSLISVGQGGGSCMATGAMQCGLINKATALLAKIRLVWKCVPESSTLAYYANT